MLSKKCNRKWSPGGMRAAFLNHTLALLTAAFFTAEAYASCSSTIANDWGTGSTVVITLQNDTGNTLNSWSTTATFDHSSVSTSWGDATRSGSNPAVFTSITSAPAFQPGESRTIYLNADRAHGSVAEAPELSGDLCDSATHLPLGFSASDIGNVGIPGNVQGEEDAITISASGNDIGGQSDSFHFLFSSIDGDGEIIAKIDNVTETDESTKVGLMFRETLSDTSSNAMMLLHPSKGSAFQHRLLSGGSTASIWQESPPRADQYDWVEPTPYRARYLTPSKWLRLIRRGNEVLSYSSDDGKCWNIRWKEQISFGLSEIYAGVALTSHSNSQLATATLSDVSVSQTAPADLNEINQECSRAQVDGDLPPPTSWLAPPQAFGGTTWQLSTQNPNPQQRPASCLEGDLPSFRRAYDDDPLCPKEVTNAAWANASYDLGTGSWTAISGGVGLAGTGMQNLVSVNEVWLRKEVNLTQAEIDNLVFWGKWANSVSIYVNGVLATNLYQSWLWDQYYHLGLNDTARSALQVGVNVIAVRAGCYECGNDFAVDFGLALRPELAQYPVNVSTTSPGSKEAKMAEVFEQHTKEMAALGGTFAVYKNGGVVESRSLGWQDIQFSAPIVEDPVMRLASVDKRVTEAIIVDLYNKGMLNPDAKVFGSNGILNDVTPLGGTWGDYVRDITVDHLRTHTSGITPIGGVQSWQDEIAFRFGVQPTELTNLHRMSIFSSIDIPAEDRPGLGVFNYSSNGYAVLQAIVQRVSGKSATQYLAEDMNSADIVLASEYLADRHEREPGYLIIGRETRSRWVELYGALSASAEALAQFLVDYAPLYERVNNAFLRRSGGQGGAMDGSRAGASADINSGRGIAHIWNSDMGRSRRFDDGMAKIEQDLVEGSCDPRENLGERYRLQNYWRPQQFLMIEPVSAGAPPSLRMHLLENGGWESAKWRFRKVAGVAQDYYIIENAWLNHGEQVLKFDSGELIATTSVADSDLDAHWKLIDSGTYFRLESRSNPGVFINYEDESLQVSGYGEWAHSTRWWICN